MQHDFAFSDSVHADLHKHSPDGVILMFNVFINAGSCNTDMLSCPKRVGPPENHSGLFGPHASVLFVRDAFLLRYS